MRPDMPSTRTVRPLALLLFLVFFLQIPAAAAADSALPAQMRLTRHVVTDPKANSMTAMTLYLPEGWRFEGDVLWDLQSTMYPARLMFQAMGPGDGTEVLHIPMLSFNFTTPPTVPAGQKSGGAIVRPPMKSEAVLREIFPTLRKRASNVQVKSVERPKDMEAMLKGRVDILREAAKAQKQPNQIEPAAISYDLAAISLTYTENGQRFRETLYTAVMYYKITTRSQLLDSHSRPYMARIESTTWTCFPIISVRAYADKFKAHELEFKVIGSNAAVDRTWFATVQAVGQKLIAENFNQPVLGDEKIRETINAVHDDVLKQQEAQANSQISQARTNQRRVDGIRGVERYSTGESGSVAVPAGYQQVWENKDGSVIMQNASPFNPGQGNADDWRKIERVR